MMLTACVIFRADIFGGLVCNGVKSSNKEDFTSVPGRKQATQKRKKKKKNTAKKNHEALKVVGMFYSPLPNYNYT